MPLTIKLFKFDLKKFAPPVIGPKIVFGGRKIKI